MAHISRSASQVHLASRGLDGPVYRRRLLHEPRTALLAELFLFEQPYRLNVDFGGTPRADNTIEVLLEFVCQKSLQTMLDLMLLQTLLLTLLGEFCVELFERNQIQRLIIGELPRLDSDTLGLEFLEAQQRTLNGGAAAALV